MRRTGVGSGGHPGSEVLTEYAKLAAAELSWSREHMEAEMLAVEGIFEFNETTKTSLA